MNERDIFIAALQIDDDAQRVAYLDEACAGDTDLRNRVDALYGALHQAGSYLEQPAVGPVATIDQPITEQPGSQIDSYRLLQQIGEGGMGVVYMAEQTEPVERRVALKIIKPGMDTRQVIARFEAERQALAMMDHPNIAKVLDAGTTESGRPYFVMELVKGVPVTQYCDEKQLSPRERLELFVPICQAVQHAHQKGIIHRDIKPSNVLVAEYDDRAVPKIIDFGVAKAIEKHLTEKTVFTEFGQVVGTIEYMSPEQAKLNQLDIDTRTDIYSLGVLLYELLTGETPFDPVQLRSAAFDEMLRIIREEEPPRPSLKLSTNELLPAIAANRHVEPKKLSTLVHGELDWIVMKALEKDRTRRYETASKFAEDVEHYLNDEAVTACPPSAAYRLRKFARRNKAVIATCAAIVAALVVGTGVATWQAVRATHQRNRAVAAEAKTAAEAERADTEAAIAKAVSDFLVKDLLQMASPKQQANYQISEGPDIKLRTLIDRAAERIETRFADQPRAGAEIRNVLGAVYSYLGEYEKAEKLFEQTIEIQRRTEGEEHPFTLKCMRNLALTYLRHGRYNEAATLLGKIIELQRRTLGDEHPELLDSMCDLACVYEKQGQYEKAEELHRQTIDIARRTLGEENHRTLMSLGNLALLYRAQGRYEEAETLNRQVLDVFRRTLGNEHPFTLTAMNNLAGDYQMLERYEEAETLLRQTLESERRILGEEHPQTLTSMDNLASVYESQGRYEEAEKLFLQTLESRRRILGEDNPNTLHTSQGLALVYKNQQRYEEAITLLLQTLEIQRRTLGEDHPSTVSSMANLASTYRNQCRYKEAETLFDQTLEIFRRTLGEEHPYTLRNMSLLARIYVAEGRYEQAEALSSQALENQRRTLGDAHSDTLDSVETLSDISWRLATAADAEKRNPVKAVALAKRVVEFGSDEADYWGTLGVALYSNGEFNEAVKTLEKASAMHDGNDPEHQFFLAMAYWHTGQRDKAIENYAEAVSWLKDGDRKEEQQRFQAEAERLIKPNEITENAQQETTNQEVSDE